MRGRPATLNRLDRSGDAGSVLSCKWRVQRPGSGRAKEAGSERPGGGTQPTFIHSAQAMIGLQAREGVMKQDLDFSVAVVPHTTT